MSQLIAVEPVRILAVSGSLREASFNRRLLELARADLMSDPQIKNVVLEIYSALGAIEPFSEDDETSESAGVHDWRGALAGADGVFIATPEYNASIPGQLKNALDWASRAAPGAEPGLRNSAMYGKCVAVASSSTGQFGGVWAADELRKSLKAQGARLVDSVSIAVGSARSAFDENGQLVSQDQRARLNDLVAALVAEILKVRQATAHVSVVR